MDCLSHPPSMRLLARLIAVLFVLMCSTPDTRAGESVTQPGGTLNGRTVDPFGHPIAGVQVSVTSEVGGTLRVTFSDEDGRFSVSDVSRGQYVLTVSRIGFLT